MLIRERAAAKVNLTLHIHGRRADGFHELDSFVAFAGCAADALTLSPAPALGLHVVGPFAAAAGEGGDNLVLKAVQAATERIDGLKLGLFSLVKRIPVAAGLGGGSADAGAALRLIAEKNGLALNDHRLHCAAAAVGSDVPACLGSRAARMTGRGEKIDLLKDFAPIPAVLANPMKALSTAKVFSALALRSGESLDAAAPLPAPRQRGGWTGAPALSRGGIGGVERGPSVGLDNARFPPDPVGAGPPSHFQGEGSAAAIDVILTGRNDLELPARALMPEIALGLDALSASEGCRLARMSGSGATVFGLYDDQRAARRAARALHKSLPGWWIRPTLLR
ncbi:4-(cytidine 5'-diphospho)-2-C-methyl-D-erythritol kinase [Hansschlegelia zhihuaiae]|uniref:4-diphosphocytidyl-2-C-methyl-D-erythritol kinase n=1 Tax=Hansschlegelia zhihuaiae TaxID=405005 RepID=A0A4Q0M528_9HYPH|nr:4-(cytidine 5'-diphospho)-2-C-methyl-D-erythritol kinase [Hansschlegelia zhihuaiae]RXF68077.1 4-(cytidine 5'-diphospho)-2-C-methyl-D-erythritol kinase [Hansschlegelia zhihuaiae]